MHSDPPLQDCSPVTLLHKIHKEQGEPTCGPSYLEHRSGRSAKMVHFLKAVNRCGNAFHSRLQLEGQKLRVVARLVQVTAMEPKPLLLCRFPHISLLAFPWAGVFGRIRA